MRRISKRDRNLALLLGMLTVSLLLYAAAESGSDSLTTGVMTVLSGLMVLTIALK